MKPIELEEQGFVDVAVKDADSDEVVSKRLDLYQLNNRMTEICNRLADKPVEQLQAIVDMLSEMGFPTCSHRLAAQLYKAITERIAELDGESKKKDTSSESASPTPSCADSTTPASSVSPPANDSPCSASSSPSGQTKSCEPVAAS
jgi:hypothetical protein